MIIQLSQLNSIQKQAWLQHAVAPRPIALASTINSQGQVNLSPFSFFNMFSTVPPIVIFSPSRRVRNNTTKHTLENVLDIAEVVIHICDEAMVQQVSLSSCEYDKGLDEFIKAGFTKEPATMVQPPMVKEAKIKLECKVLEVKPLGTEGGAGNLVIAEVLCLHVDDSILNEDGTMIDQTKMHHIARLGGDWYCRVTNDNLFKVAKPNVQLGIGIDALPTGIKNSTLLTGNHLGQLANVHEMPAIDVSFVDDNLTQIVQYFAVNPGEMEKELHRYAATLLNAGNVTAAWQVLLAGETT
jgi:flavin reductase (DIM6/NTAB) family NADH-FMN oxidoreductase RutF